MQRIQRKSQNLHIKWDYEFTLLWLSEVGITGLSERVRVSELFAHNIRWVDVPTVVTDGTPHPMPEKGDKTKYNCK